MPAPSPRKHARPRTRGWSGKRILVPVAALIMLVGGGGALYFRAEVGPLFTSARPLETGRVPAPPKGDCTAAPTLKQGPECGAWFGVYVPPRGDSLLASLDALEGGVGRRFDIVFAYHDMSTTENGRLLRGDEPEIGRDRLLLLGWESELWDSGRNIPWRDIASGAVDRTVIDPQAQRIKEYGRPVLIGFDGEMELREDSGSPEEYVAAYRHIVDRFRALGVDNVAWVWGVTGYLDYRDQWKAFYPGDTYVDWISYDPYNFARCRNAGWQTFEETVRPAHDWFVRNGFGDKPFVISEYGTETDPDRPGARGEWYNEVPEVLKRLPRIKAVLQWNAVDAAGCDFRLEGPGVLPAFSGAGRDPYLNQDLPKSGS
ncbi:glycoside hydrolase family 26 protein [Spongiactinospora sp. 9N601]|uniref:glycoside hydrolase family 26 protein n=1 Tax=Spongiactinospora sp. 9N601 TaxID=3375149 RepID=UPI0037B7E347